MHEQQPDTDELLDRVSTGDQSATQELFERFRKRLHGMVAVHLDRRVRTRLDPSDVVQETFAEAFEKLPGYAHDRTISFYPWLRRIAWQRLVKLHEQHLMATRRSVQREDAAMPLPDDSVMQLANQLAGSGTEPGQAIVKQEMRERVRTALEELPPADREVLVMRYLEHLTIQEISETLEVSPGAVKKRHFRALERLERVLGDAE